jgi:hypothetical protein
MNRTQAGYLTVCVMLLLGTTAYADTLQVAKLYSDATDVTHFEDQSIDWLPYDTADGILAATDLFPADQIGFLRINRNYRSDWHPAPKKQYVMVLTGVLEVEAGDGERRVFHPGSVLLVADTEGRGHRTNSIGETDALLVWVPIP